MGCTIHTVDCNIFNKEFIEFAHFDFKPIGYKYKYLCGKKEENFKKDNTNQTNVNMEDFKKRKKEKKKIPFLSVKGQI